MMKSRSGFTIVELLIVIVVIAVLATISVVTYNGIQQRARNTAIISAANQVFKSISGYATTSGNLPLEAPGNHLACVVPAQTCTYGGVALDPSSTGATALKSNIATISSGLPSSIVDSMPSYNGITYLYTTNLSYTASTGGIGIIIYTLHGEQQQCNNTNIVESVSSGVLGPSTTGWTTTSGGFTFCYIVASKP